MTEMVGNAAVITRTIDLPLIADADTGYGNELNVTRTVVEYERAGVSGMHLEDQVSPKRCGHLAGKEVVERDEFLAKVRAAAAARRNPDFVLIARTDSRSVLGLEEALWRANAALAAGADLAFVEAIPDLEELAAGAEAGERAVRVERRAGRQDPRGQPAGRPGHGGTDSPSCPACCSAP